MSTYPKLMWSPLGVEVTVQSAGEQAEKEAEGYRETPEKPAPIEPVPDVLDDPDGVPPADPDNDPPTFGPADDGTGEGPSFGPPMDPL